MGKIGLLIVVLLLGFPSQATDNFWQITLAHKFARSDGAAQFWRTHKVGDKIEVSPACDPKARPFATAQGDSKGGWKLSGTYGNLSAQIDSKDRLTLDLKGEEFGKGQRISPVTACNEAGIPKKIRNMLPQKERSLAALTGGAAHMQAAATATLPTLREPAPASLPERKDTLSYLKNGDAYACHTTPVALAAVRALDGVPTLGEVPDIWPGALLKGSFYAKGVLAPISIPRSAGATISIAGVNLEAGAHYYTKIEGPTSRATINDAVQKLLAQGIKGTEASAISFRTDVISNPDQLAYMLGVDGRFLNGLDTNLPIDQGSGKSFVVASFRQVFYSVAFQDPEEPYSVFQDGENFADKGNQIGPDSPPLYIKSVSYGRLIFFLISSPFDADAVILALNSAREGKSEGQVKSKGKSYSYHEILNGSSIAYLVMGGDAIPALGDMGKMKNVENAYDSLQAIIADPKLGQVSAVTKGVPIGYSIGYLTSLATASMGFSTTYNRTDCITTPKKYASFWMWFLCVDDMATVTLMDKTGKESLLWAGTTAPRMVEIDSNIPEDQSNDDFTIRLRLNNNGGPSCLNFQLYRRRFGQIEDFSGFSIFSNSFLPIAADMKNVPSLVLYPQNPLGGSWAIGQIVDFGIRINRGTGDASVIFGR